MASWRLFYCILHLYYSKYCLVSGLLMSCIIMSLFSWWNKREGQHNLECSLASLLRGDILALGVYIVRCVI